MFVVLICFNCSSLCPFFTYFLSEVSSSVRAPPGVQSAAQQQCSGDLLLSQKQTAPTEQPAAAEGTDILMEGFTEVYNHTSSS